MSSTEALDAEGSAVLSDTALSALELREQPFELRPADGEAFTDDVTAEQLSDIRQALITGDDLLLILGEDGAGKSTLLNQLASNSGLRIQCFSVTGGPRFSTRNLFMGMLEAFKVEPPDDLKATLDELIPCLQAMIAGNKLCVVVLDDAEALARHELTTLLSGMLYINNRDESLLRIALSARPAFEDDIPDLLPQGADLPYSSLSLEPFDDARATAYLAYRFEAAGRYADLPFDAVGIAAMNERAQGRPGALHEVAASVLERAYGVARAAPISPRDDIAPVPEADLADVDLPPELRARHRRPASAGFLGKRGVKLGLGLLASALIVGGLLLFRPAPDPGTNDERLRLVEQSKVETARESERLRLLREAEAARADGTRAPGSTIAADRPSGVAAGGGSGSTAGGTAPGSSGGESEDTRPARVAVPDNAAVEAPAVDVATAGTSRAPDASTRSTEVPTTDAVATARPVPGPEGASDDAAAASAPESVAAPPANPQTVVVAEAESADSSADRSGASAVANEPQSGAAPDGGTPRTDVALLGGDAGDPSVMEPPAPPPIGALESPNWVLVQNPDQFTVQMSASTDRASVEQFLDRAELAAPNSIFQFEREGRTWFALVHGLYPSIGEARNAIERMTDEAQTNQPWIRDVGRIQETLREQN